MVFKKGLRRIIEENTYNLRIALDNAVAIYDAVLAKARDTHQQSTKRIKAHYSQAAEVEEETFENTVRKVKEYKQQETALVEEKYRTIIAEAKAKYEKATLEIEGVLTSSTNTAEKEYEISKKKANEQYALKSQEVRNYFEKLELNEGWGATPWSQDIWDKYTPLTGYHIPRVTRFGHLTSANRFDPLSVPALIPIIGYKNILLKASGDGKQQALETMQAVALRLLATLPAGRLHLTMIDPVGLGKNMGGLVNLPDELSGGKVWTEANHIEQQLQKLSEHMEIVIQKYLSNQYQTMEDYNREAEEVEEPYRLLVIANFPINFSESAAKRLVSIATNGPSTGVYVVATVDMDAKLPHNFNLADLERSSSVIAYERQTGKFLWDTPTFKDYNLTLEEPPTQKRFNDIVERIGVLAVENDKVEVPFEKITLLEKDWWLGTTIDGIKVPIGRQGAREIQEFVLGTGKETAQHVLIAGRTGSGKSTLLHAIIVSLALKYSPEELELYLLDFKLVEFSIYARYRLPHAKVIAVQGDREYGLSMLEKLNSELLRRKVVFQEAECTNYSTYRTKVGIKLPRYLLIVDEFHQLFTEDDNLARQALGILEHIVREGRAFGIHIVMASQSLRGAAKYITGVISEQMGVRIALQCSDQDSRLILSDDNNAARLLSRPGEAFYNDDNGKVGANERFQVVMLKEVDHKNLLDKLSTRAKLENYITSQIVFEGNKPADIRDNLRLRKQFSEPDMKSEIKVARAWLGEPVAIKDHTTATFQHRSRSNMLILGQDERTAISILASSFISLAAQYDPKGVKFYFLDTTRDNVDWAGLFDELCSVVPHPVAIIRRRRQIEQVVGEIADLVNERIEDEEGNYVETIYLIVIGLHKLRDLRKAEGFGFPLDNQPPKPSERFATIIREGPEIGVHSLIWCDTFVSLERTFDLRTVSVEEFDLKVALQMSRDDSQKFIGVPHAQKLGLNRAYFSDEDQLGSPEKFRPYDLPKAEWFKEQMKCLTELVNQVM